MIKNILEKVFSKADEKGIKITCWITSILSISFFIQFIISLISNTIFQGFHIINRIVIGTNYKHELEWLILLYLLSILVVLVPLLITNVIRNWTRSKLKEDLDKKSIFFATGIYLIITNIIGVISVINSIAGLLFNARWGWGVHINFEAILYLFIGISITVLYFVIGIKYIKKSDFLSGEKTEDVIEVLIE